MDHEIGSKFSNALCHYIKREVNNALLRHNRLPFVHLHHKSPEASPLKKTEREKPEGLTDLTFDTVLLGDPKVAKLSHSNKELMLSQGEGELGPVSNQECSLEDEIVREISTSLVNKMDGLRVLFNEVRD